MNRRERREQADQERKFIGQDVHAAFVQAHEEPGKSPLVSLVASWDEIPACSRELYQRMASCLNVLLERMIYDE